MEAEPTSDSISTDPQKGENNRGAERSISWHPESLGQTVEKAMKMFEERVHPRTFSRVHLCVRLCFVPRQSF